MIDISIHPRVRTHSDKVNTCKPRSAKNGGQGGKALRRASERLSLRQKDWQATQNNKDNKAIQGYRKPGSMKT